MRTNLFAVGLLVPAFMLNSSTAINIQESPALVEMDSMEPMIAEISALPSASAESELVPEQLPQQKSKTFLNMFRGVGQLAKMKAKTMRENPGQTNLSELPATSSPMARKRALLKKKGPKAPFMMDEKEVNGLAKLAGIDMDEVMNMAKTGEVNPVEMNKMMGSMSNMAMKGANMLVAHPKMLQGTVDKMMDNVVKSQVLQTDKKEIDKMVEEADKHAAPIAKMLGMDTENINDLIHSAADIAASSATILQNKVKQDPNHKFGIMDMDLIEELVDQPKVIEYVDKVTDAMDGFLSLDAAKKRTGLSDQPPVDDWDWVEEAWNSDTARAAIVFFAMLVSYLFYSVFLQNATTAKPIAKKQQPIEDPLLNENQSLLNSDSKEE